MVNRFSLMFTIASIVLVYSFWNTAIEKIVLAAPTHSWIERFMFLFAFNLYVACAITIGAWRNSYFRESFEKNATFNDMFTFINKWMFVMNLITVLCIYFGMNDLAYVVFVCLFTPLLAVASYGVSEFIRKAAL